MSNKVLTEKDNKGISYADKRRAERSDALRELLSGQKLIAQINNDLDRDIHPDELNVVKFKTETRLKLLSKVMPDLKAVEHSGELDHSLIIQTIERKIVKAND